MNDSLRTLLGSTCFIKLGYGDFPLLGDIADCLITRDFETGVKGIFTSVGGGAGFSFSFGFSFVFSGAF